MDVLRQLAARLREERLRRQCGTPVWFRCQLGIAGAIDEAAWLASMVELAVTWIGAEPESVEAVVGRDGQRVWLCRFARGQAALLTVAELASGEKPYVLCDAIGQHGAVYLEEVPLPGGWRLQPLPEDESVLGRRWAERVVEVIHG